MSRHLPFDHELFFAAYGFIPVKTAHEQRHINGAAVTIQCTEYDDARGSGALGHSVLRRTLLKNGFVKKTAWYIKDDCGVRFNKANGTVECCVNS